MEEEAKVDEREDFQGEEHNPEDTQKKPRRIPEETQKKQGTSKKIDRKYIRTKSRTKVEPKSNKPITTLTPTDHDAPCSGQIKILQHPHHRRRQHQQKGTMQQQQDDADDPRIQDPHNKVKGQNNDLAGEQVSEREREMKESDERKR